MGDEMNGFTAEELDAIAVMVEDQMPALEMIQRRTGLKVASARATYAQIAAKASAGADALRKAKAKAEEKDPLEEALK